MPHAYAGPFQTPPPPDPEDFYRTPSPDSHSYAQTTSPSSPTDSHAAIMEHQSQPGSFPFSSDSHNHSNQHEAFYPPPTIPEARDSYRFSTGVINGEIGGDSNTTASRHSPSPTNEHIPAAPLSAHLPRSASIGPLSAGLPRTPGTAKEADRVEHLELKARKHDRKDLAIKLKVRLAKVVLRSINCACSLVVLALVASTFAIFYATRHMAKRNDAQPWATDTPQWPQIVTLVVACISLCLGLFIMYSYWRGGHNLAEKAALRATVIAGALFLLTVIMWASIIGIMQAARGSNDGKDIWGWACNDNTRRKLFQDSIDYTLVCRQQDWVVVCAIIEISVEFLAIMVYLFAFWRIFYSKRKLRKSMNLRDEARASLWLAQLKERGDDLEAGGADETSKNTAYNQLNSNTQVVPEKSSVPILQAVPMAARRNGSVVGTPTSDGIPPVPPPPVLPAAIAEMQGGQRSPRVVSFAPAK